MSFQFTPDQQKAITGICNTLLKPTAFKYSVITVLTGAAGTGKTTVIGEIIKQINKLNMHMPISLCATTHRAATVLENIVNTTVYTGHALFKLRPSVTKW